MSIFKTDENQVIRPVVIEEGNIIINIDSYKQIIKYCESKWEENKNFQRNIKKRI